MGLSRHFLNLIVYDDPICAWSLRCIDLRRLQLFYPDLTVLVAANDGLSSPLGSRKMTRTVIPNPIFSFKPSKWEGVIKPGGCVPPWSANCVPVAGRKMLCSDGNGRSLLFDADTRQVVTMPTIPRFKLQPVVSVFIPSAGDDADPDPDGTLFIMTGKPKQERRDLGPQSPQFDALVYRRRSSMTTKSWQHQHTPPLPCLREPKYWKEHSRTWITSYAVLGGGSHIIVSTFAAGTYCLDTVNHTWSKVGDWRLPFSGKVEYVPELNLWFGIGGITSIVGLFEATDELVAADLSTLDYSKPPEPKVVGTWKELDQMPIHSNNKLVYLGSRSKLVYLGSRKFCIARFISGYVVFTGVEVNPQVLGDFCSGGGEDKFLMFRHKSRVALTKYAQHMF